MNIVCGTATKINGVEFLDWSHLTHSSVFDALRGMKSSDLRPSLTPFAVGSGVFLEFPEYSTVVIDAGAEMRQDTYIPEAKAVLAVKRAALDSIFGMLLDLSPDDREKFQEASDRTPLFE